MALIGPESCERGREVDEHHADVPGDQILHGRRGRDAARGSA